MTDLVNYQGRLISKEGFRVFVYGLNNASKLVNSYDEYEVALDQGWKCTPADVEDKKMVQVDLEKVVDLAKGKQRHKRG